MWGARSVNFMVDKIAVCGVGVARPARVGEEMQLLHLLRVVSCAVPAGGRLAIIGPSGAGKSSLLRLLNRLDDPASGEILLDGVALTQLEPVALRRRVAMLFQQPTLFDDTVLVNLAYPLKLANQQLTAERATALLTEVGLAPELLERMARQLSGGQQQRVALARALALAPEVLLLDEPTAALDEESADALISAMLRRNAESGLTLVMVTHTREILMRLACPTLLLSGGTGELYPDADCALEVVAQRRLEVA